MTLQIVTRTELGWPATNAGRADTDKGMVAHYDSANGHLFKSDHTTPKPHSACITYWKWVRHFHMETRGWADVGYAYFMCPHGVAFEGRTYGYRQAAQLSESGKLPDGNTRWTSCTFGTGPSEPVTPAALQGWRLLRERLRSRHGMAAVVHGHRDFTSTSCPGDPVYSLVRSGALAQPPVPDHAPIPVPAPLPVPPPVILPTGALMNMKQAAFRTSTAQPFSRGEWLLVEWDTEMVDPENAHQNGSHWPTILKGPAYFDLSFSAELSAEVPAGSSVELRAMSYKFNSETHTDDPKEEYIHGVTVISDRHMAVYNTNGMLPRDHKLRVQVKAEFPADVAANLLRANVSVLYVR